MKRLKEVLPIIDGLFNHMDYQFLIDKSQLDILFLAQTGMRIPAPILTLIHDMDSEDAVLTDSELNALGNMILNYYRESWDRLKSIYDLNYDPIHNFSDNLTEIITGTESEQGETYFDEENTNKKVSNDVTQLTDNGTNERLIADQSNRTDTRTDNLTQTTTDSNQNNIYGFNSSNPSGESQNQGTGTQINTGTVSNSENSNSTRTDGFEYTSNKSESKNGELKDDSVKIGEGSHNKELTQEKERSVNRKGNIGNISTQKLIKEEIELWRWNFINRVITDVKNFVSLEVYV